MSKYPTLSEMGIKNPGEIERYSLNTTNNIDVLRIFYRRKKGSLLPVSKRFEYGRAMRSIVADSGTGKTEQLYQISPFLKKAIDEMDGIIDGKKSNLEYTKMVKQELQYLKKEMTSRLAYIESLIDEM